MDLIYANEHKEDIGVLQFYALDMAYGESENNFELELNLLDHCLDYGYFIYAQNTEYGGIVDTIYVDNGKGIVKYKGRTWQGILANAVIQPDGDYYDVSGDAHDVIRGIVEKLGLTDIFTVPQTESGVYINSYSFRYTNAYQGILEMLKEYFGKILFAWKGDKVELSCQMAIDFTNDDEWDSSQIEFEISQNNRPLNHLICLGQGNLSDRAVIHLFTDEDGNVQPYANENPMEDADYILDESQKVLFGIDEVADTYDYSSAEIRTTYIPLEEEPDDFMKNHTNYFKKVGDGFERLQIIQQELFSALSSQPSDWSSKFGSYYVKEGNEYKSLESVTTDLYQALSSMPNDWFTNYGNYFKKVGNTYESLKAESRDVYTKLSTEPKDWKKAWDSYFTFNGVDYDKASGDSKDIYTMHTGKPSDWSDNYSSYYWKVPKYGIKASNNKKGYETYIVGSEWMAANSLYIIDKDKIKEWKDANPSKRKKININKLVSYYSQYKKKPKWQKNTYYNKGSESIAPKFRANYYYSLKVENVAPTFVANNFYKKVTVTTAPTFVANTYYMKSVVDVYEKFVSLQIFRQSEDRFGALVEEGIKKLQENFAEKDSARVDLEELQEYDINDIVGARENVTGVTVKHYISKKIINIKDGIITVDYTIGKE